MGTTSINITKQTLKALSQIGTVIVLALCAALPALAADSNADMEASAMCADGRCFAPQKDTGLGMLLHAAQGLKETVAQTATSTTQEKENELYRKLTEKEGDRRRRADLDGAEKYLRPVGQVLAEVVTKGSKKASQLSKSTGFLITPCHVMTTAHSVFGKKDVYDVSKVTFVVGGKSYSAEIVEGDPRAYGMPTRDKAVLFLPACPGNNPEIGWIKIASAKKYAIGEKLQLAAFYYDKDDSLWVDPNCEATDIEAGESVLVHTCMSRPRASGGLIFAMGPKNGKPYAMGMTVGTEYNQNYDVDSARYVALSSDEFLDQQKKYMTIAQEYLSQSPAQLTQR